MSKRLWVHPWGYTEGFIFSLGFLAIGFLLEYLIQGRIVTIPGWPYNFIIGSIFIGTIFFFWLYFKNSLIIKWLGSVPAAISSLTLFVFIVLLMGFIPQAAKGQHPLIQVLGLGHITSSWPFFLSQIYFITSLSFTILKRAIPFSKKNIGFLLNHLGLWIIVFAGGVGSASVKTLTMYVKENQTVWYAYDEKDTLQALPLAIKLLDFDIEEYNSKVGIINNATSKLAFGPSENIMIAQEKGIMKIRKWEIGIDKFLPLSSKFNQEFYAVNEKGAAPSARISVVNTESNDTIKGWITCGSSLVSPQALKLNEQYSLVMLMPEPKRFFSEVQVYTKDGLIDKTIIEVNKPYKVKGWKIYQSGYDEKFGKWSELSIFQLVKDPWLPFVYSGIFMLFLGLLFIFWEGNYFKK